MGPDRPALACRLIIGSLLRDKRVGRGNRPNGSGVTVQCCRGTGRSARLVAVFIPRRATGPRGDAREATNSALAHPRACACARRRRIAFLTARARADELLLTVLVGGERAAQALLPQPQRHSAAAAAALREDGHRPHPHPPCIYAKAVIISCSFDLHVRRNNATCKYCIYDLTSLSPQGRQTLRVVPFWMPALMLMAMALLLVLLLLIPLRSAALRFSAAAPLRPDRRISQEAKNTQLTPTDSQVPR